MTRPSRSLVLLLIGALLAGCPGSPAARKPLATTPRPAATNAATNLAQTTVAASLIGKVKVVSNNGGGIVSNNGGGIVGNNGGGIVGNNGGGVIGNNGAGVVSAGGARYHVRQAGAPVESLLADARIEVLDAQRRPVPGKDGKPLETVTDKTGSYSLKGELPAQNLILRIKLWQGGELYAFLVRGSHEVDIDTSSTLGAAYVLDQYVKQDQVILDRLPASEAEALHKDAEAARGLADDGIKSYKFDVMARAAADLRGKAKALDATLERIKAILLLGQRALGSGLPATSVPLVSPVNVFRDAKGNTYIGESLGRIRRIAPDGTIHLYAGLGANPELGVSELGQIIDMVGDPDGTLYVALDAVGKVLRLGTDGKVTVVAGGGSSLTGPKGTDLVLAGRPRIAADGHGGLYIPSNATAGSHLYHVAADGATTELPAPEDPAANEIAAVAARPDGTVFAATSTVDKSKDLGNRRLWRLRPGGSWERIPSPPDVVYRAELGMVASATRLYVGRIGPIGYDAFDDTNQVTTVAGKPAATAVAAGDVYLSGLFGIWASPDDTQLVFNDYGPMTLVEKAGGAFKVIAGVPSGRAGDTLVVNAPVGIAFDSHGRLVVAETGASSIRRLDGDKFELLVGQDQLTPDGVAQRSMIYEATLLAVAGEDLYVMDGDRNTVMLLHADGRITHALGYQTFFKDAPSELTDGQMLPALQASFGRISALAVDPQGRLVVADATRNMVGRLTPDGQYEVIAGATTGASGARAGDAGDGGPAAASRLSAPSGLAFDSKGNLYIADTLNSRIRRLRPDGVIETFAGMPLAASLERVGEGKLDTGPVAAKEAVLVAPTTLCVDKDDNVYVAELGTELSHKLGSAAALFDALPHVAPSIRRITQAGQATLVAGRGTQVLAGANNDEALILPAGMAFDPQGRLVVADSLLGQVLVVPAAALK